MTVCECGPIRQERRYPVPFAASRRECREVPLLCSESSTPWSPDGMSSEGWSTFRMTSDLDPRFGFPREGENRRGNQDAFCLPRTRRVVSLFALTHVDRLQSTSRHAAPSRGEVALQSRGARLFDRFVL